MCKRLVGYSKPLPFLCKDFFFFFFGNMTHNEMPAYVTCSCATTRRGGCVTPDNSLITPQV